MKIAVIGTGITGNSAAWLLNQSHEVEVFEAGAYVGGHSNTVSGDAHADVDTGFIVYNEWTYPNLIALFEHLGVETVPTDMSFAASLDGGALEYSGDALFGQWRNFFRPSYYRMLLDIVRFYKHAPSLLEGDDAPMSLGEYLTAEKYSQAFIDYHILPMAAAIWSTGTEDVRNFPAASFVRFFVNHGLFLLKDRPRWHTVVGGSRRYVEKLTAGFRDKVHLNNPVTKVLRKDDGVEITDSKGVVRVYDHVVIATHSDQALKVLEDASDEEAAVLGAFPYAPNVAYLHEDVALMPKRRSVWSSWNYLTTNADQSVCLSYWMNKLQPFVGEKDLFVTLNPPEPPAEDKTFAVIPYDHPQFTMGAIEGWEKIKDIQGVRRTWFCGAWCGYGFHEDGITAGLAVAEAIGGVKRPWDVVDKSPAGENCRPVS